MFLAMKDMVDQLQKWKSFLHVREIKTDEIDIEKLAGLFNPPKKGQGTKTETAPSKNTEPWDSILVVPFPPLEGETSNKEDGSHLTGVACQLSLGSEVYLTSEEVPRVLSNKNSTPFFNIEPGEFAVLITHEYVYLPADTIGLISVRNSYKEKGLVSVSGFHVDPGFRGRIVFTVYNAGPQPVPLRFRESIFMIAFAKLSQKTEPYNGSHLGQTGIRTGIISSLQGPSISPRKLDERLRRLESEVRLLWAPLAAALVAAVLSLVLG